MKKLGTVISVSLIMIIALLAITNPARKQFDGMFDRVEGEMTNNYFIFSIYQRYDYTVSDDKKYRIFKRYIGIALNLFEISPLKIKLD